MPNVYFRMLLAGRAPTVYFKDWTSVKFEPDGLRVPVENVALLEKLRTSSLHGNVYQESPSDPRLMAATVLDANARLVEKDQEIASLKAEIAKVSSSAPEKRRPGRPKRLGSPRPLGVSDPVAIGV